MTAEKFEREKAYQITLYIARTMLQKGILKEVDMKKVDEILKTKYAPPLGWLYS